jgi:hypothetical protein
MNITIRHKIYCLYPYSIREFCLRKKNYLYVYPQYPFVSDPFSSLRPADVVLFWWCALLMHVRCEYVCYDLWVSLLGDVNYITCFKSHTSPLALG